MKVIDAPSASGPKGDGRIEILDNTNVQVTINEDGKTTQYPLEFTQGVDMVQLGNWQLQNVTDVFVQLSADKLDIRYVRPRNGTFYVSFSRFGAEEGELPTIRYAEGGKPFVGAKWDNPERNKAYALYEILNPGVYKGMEALDIVTYEFQWDENLEEFCVVGTKKKWHEHFLTVLNVFGFDIQHDTLHYTGEEYDAGGPTTIANVLPEIEDIFKQRNKLGQITIEDGWIDSKSVRPGPFGMTREGLEAAMAEQENNPVTASP